MLNSLTLDDASGTPVGLISPPKREVVSVSGLAGISSLRDSKRVRPQQHGAISDTRFEDGRSIVVHGQIGSNVSIMDAFSEFRSLTAVMLQTLDNAPALLKWTEGSSGLALQREVKLDGEVDPELSGQASIIDYQAQFFAEDPRAYSQSQTTATGVALSALGGGLTFNAPFNWHFASSGGGTVSIANAGNRPTPPVFRVYGYVLAPVLVNLNTGARITLTGGVASGSYLELDSFQRTVMLGGTIPQSNLIDSSLTQWADLPANATSDWQLIAADFDGTARLDVLARDAYA